MDFQSQLCRVSHQSAPRRVYHPLPLVLFLLYRLSPPPVSSLISQNSRCSEQSLSRVERARNASRTRHESNPTGSRSAIFDREPQTSLLNEAQFQVPAAVRGSLSPRVKSVKAEGEECSRIIKGSPESDRWKDKRTEA